MSRHPTVKWAQRSDKLFITIELPDAKDVKQKLDPDGKFFFSAKSADNIPYEVDMELFDRVDVEKSKSSIGLRHIFYVIQKEEKKWWTRLVKQQGKPPIFLKVDWDKWIDEDDEKGADMDFGDMDFSKLDMGGDDYDMDDTLIDDEEKEEEGAAIKKEEAASASDEKA